MDLELINSREFAKRVLNYKKDKTIQAEVQEIYFQFYNKKFKYNCRNCIVQAYAKVRQAIENQMILTEPNKKQMGLFEIKKSKGGLSKQIHIDHEVVTNDNLTDEKAINILRKAPGHIVTFSRFPANWRDLIAVEQPKKSKVKEEVIELPVEETVIESVEEIKPIEKLTESVVKKSKKNKK